MSEWLHALASILVIKEKAVTGGFTASGQVRVWQNRIRTLKHKSRGLWHPSSRRRPTRNTMGRGNDSPTHCWPAHHRPPSVRGRPTGSCHLLLATSVSLAPFLCTLGTKMKCRILASTIKSIHNQTCRTCGVTQRLIIFMPNKDGTRWLVWPQLLGDLREPPRFVLQFRPMARCQLVGGSASCCSATLFVSCRHWPRLPFSFGTAVLRHH